MFTRSLRVISGKNLMKIKGLNPWPLRFLPDLSVLVKLFNKLYKVFKWPPTAVPRTCYNPAVIPACSEPALCIRWVSRLKAAARRYVRARAP
jgi:hypothetical protein